MRAEAARRAGEGTGEGGGEEETDRLRGKLGGDNSWGGGVLGIPEADFSAPSLHHSPFWGFYLQLVLI